MEESHKLLEMTVDQIKKVKGSMSQYGSRAIYIDSLIDIFCRLLKSGKFSDITVVCGASSYMVHRAVVCPRSTFFEAACKEGFAVSTSVSLLTEIVTELVLGGKSRNNRVE